MSYNKYEDWDEILAENGNKDVPHTDSNKEKLPLENDSVNPYMTNSESFWMWTLFIGGAYFIWRSMNVLIGIALNLFIGISLIFGGIMIITSVKSRIRVHQSIPHKCTNCGKTFYITQAQENYIKSGNKFECPYCRLGSD